MSNEWNELVKDDSPRGAEIAKKKQAEAVDKERYLEQKIKAPDPKDMAWNYERMRFNKLLGWKKVKEVTEGYTKDTGKVELVATSDKTLEVRNKKDYISTTYYVLRVDKSKISDLQKFDALNREITEFLKQAKEKIGEKVPPAVFNIKDGFSFGFPSGKKLIIPCLVFALGGFLFLGFSVWGALAGGLGYLALNLVIALLGIYSYRIKYAAYKPLINAYYKKVKEYEEEIKKIRTI